MFIPGLTTVFQWSHTFMFRHKLDTKLKQALTISKELSVNPGSNVSMWKSILRMSNFKYKIKFWLFSAIYNLNFHKYLLLKTCKFSSFCFNFSSGERGFFSCSSAFRLGSSAESAKFVLHITISRIILGRIKIWARFRSKIKVKTAWSCKDGIVFMCRKYCMHCVLICLQTANHNSETRVTHIFIFLLTFICRIYGKK